MSLKDLLSKEGRRRRRVETLTRRLCQRYGPSEERWNAAAELAEIGTEDAVYGLLRRFLAVSEKIGEDREEKRHVQDLVAGLGSNALPAIRSFIRREQDAVLAVECLRRCVNGEALVDELLSVLRDLGPHSARANQIAPVLAALGEMKEPRAVELALRYLDALDDSIAIAAIDCLDHIGDERGRDPLVAMLDREEVLPRIQERVQQALGAHGWAPTGKQKKARR